jgi:steroid delta-isomerase-like uncharacterized protein
MSTPSVVDAFYSQIWNRGDLAASSTLLSRDFRFRGSLGSELRGYDAFRDYVRSVRGALADYNCEILDCVTEQNKAFAKMRFSGVHVAPFRGHQATGKPVHWLGAALFLLDGGLISELWVLGDLFGLDALLEANQNQDRTPCIQQFCAKSASR